MLSTLRFVYLVWHFNRILGQPPAAQTAAQQRRLRGLLRAAGKIPFYQRLYAGIDLERCRLADLPPTTKAELQANFDDAVADRRLTATAVREFVSRHDTVGQLLFNRYVPCHTSGSQGPSALLVQEKRDLERLFAMQIARGHALPKTWGQLLSKMFGAKARWAMLLFRPGHFPSGSAFAHMPAPARRLARQLRLNLNDPFADNLDRLNEFQPNFITGYAHVLENLARAERQGRLRLNAGKQLQLLISISEPLFPERQQFISETFGVPVANHYAMAECMGLSLGCPRGHGAHLNADLAILEVVDRQFRPVPPGTAGERVLVTNLLNHTLPIIRYVIDDVVTMSPTPCPCGNPFPLISSISGRAYDRFWIRIQGIDQELPPYVFKAGIEHLAHVGDFQVTQVARDRFHMRVQPQPGTQLDADTVKQKVMAALTHEGMADAFAVDVEIVPEITADPKTGKLRRFICLIEPPETVRACMPARR